MPDFSIDFIDPDGHYNQCLVSANYMSEAIDYVESKRGGIVYKAEIRDFSFEANDLPSNGKSTEHDKRKENKSVLFKDKPDMEKITANKVAWGLLALRNAERAEMQEPHFVESPIDTIARMTKLRNVSSKSQLELCMEAVRENPLELYNMYPQTDEVIMAAVEILPASIGLVRDPYWLSAEICAKAFQGDPRTILALDPKSMGRILDEVRERYPDVYWEAWKNDIFKKIYARVGVKSHLAILLAAYAEEVWGETKVCRIKASPSMEASTEEPSTYVPETQNPMPMLGGEPPLWLIQKALSRQPLTPGDIMKAMMDNGVTGACDPEIEVDELVKPLERAKCLFPGLLGHKGDKLEKYGVLAENPKDIALLNNLRSMLTRVAQNEKDTPREMVETCLQRVRNLSEELKAASPEVDWKVLEEDANAALQSGEFKKLKKYCDGVLDGMNKLCCEKVCGDLMGIPNFSDSELLLINTLGLFKDQFSEADEEFWGFASDMLVTRNTFFTRDLDFEVEPELCLAELRKSTCIIPQIVNLSQEAASSAVLQEPYCISLFWSDCIDRMKLFAEAISLRPEAVVQVNFYEFPAFFDRLKDEYPGVYWAAMESDVFLALATSCSGGMPSRDVWCRLTRELLEKSIGDSLV